MTLIEEAAWGERLYGGDWYRPKGGAASVVEPATGQALGRVGVANAQDVASAAARACEAQRAWAGSRYTERAAVLRRAGALFEEHAEEIQRWLIRESGSVASKAEGENRGAALECYEASALASRPRGELLQSDVPRLSMARKLPVGVVGVIAPFNFPLMLAIRAVAPALALGNAVVLKPDLRTAVSGGVYVAAVFAEAGLPEGVLHVLPGRAETGEALVSDSRVPVIAFTGSSAAGRAVGVACARLLKRAHLELGGNSAVIVLEDADLERAVSAAAFGSFVHQGQICMTTGRHLVHQSLVSDYVELLADKARHLRLGDPATEDVDLGPLIDETQRDRVHELVHRSVGGGANLVAGGTYEGLFYSPTVITDAAAGTPAYAEEVFGPVAPVARFATLDEAAQLAADTDYGLSLAILTRDVMKALAVADRIPSGMVHVNDQTVADEPVAPFGGVGASGNGSRLGGAGPNVDAFTETQWLTVRSEVPTYPY